ncbi:MAG: type II toxin-antitoxin system VapC family toxin [Acidimicrobiales bacterium]
MIAYVDTSAAAKLVFEEFESEALTQQLDVLTKAGHRLVASWLLHTELRCAANRHPDQACADVVSDVLSRIALIDLERGDLTTGPLLPGRLRSGDAIHLATALRVGAEVMVVFDRELRSAARIAGIPTASPGSRDEASGVGPGFPAESPD